MSLQINFTNLTDCGRTTTTDSDSGIADAGDSAIANYIFKGDEKYDRLEGNGYFEKSNLYSNENNKELDDVKCCSVSVLRAKDIRDISVHFAWLTSDNGFPIHRFSLSCSDTLFERIKKTNVKGNLIQVDIKLSEFVDSDYYDKVAEAEVKQVVLNNSSRNFDAILIEKEIEDIRTFLKKESCIEKFGQVADVCDEFAESFRHLSKAANKPDLIYEITSLISSFRHTLHNALSPKDSAFINSLNEKYDFNMNPFAEDFEVEFIKITDKKEYWEAVKIFNHLWTTRKTEDIFRDGFPFSTDDAEYLADCYLKLKIIKSRILEKIILDLLIATTIGEKASSLQYNKQISVKTLLHIPWGIYDKEKNSKFADLTLKEIIVISVSFLGTYLLLKVLFSLFYWWLSGLVAGDNDTAHIILFGILFSTDSIITYFHHKSDGRNPFTDVPPELDEKNYYLLRDLCNLHMLIDNYRSGSFKSLLHKVNKNGTLFPISLYSIVK